MIDPTITQRQQRAHSKNGRTRAQKQDFRARRLGLELLEPRLLLTGTWTPITNLPPLPQGIFNAVLFSDGRVGIPIFPTISDPNTVSQILTPDATGNYANGTWSTFPTKPSNSINCAEEVLRDGRVMLLGGNPRIPQRTGPNVDLNTGFIYDPVSNSWTAMANFPEPTFGTGPTVLLIDGRVLAGSVNGPQTYIYDPTTNTWSAGPTKLYGDSSHYESWTKLADGSILSYDVNGNPGEVQRLDQTTMTWIDSGIVPVPLEAGISPFPNMGPGVLLPDGRLFQLGRSSQTAMYTPPSTPGGTGTWTAGPIIPDGLEAGGGATYFPGGSCAAMMPNGHVLFVAEYPATPDPILGLIGPTRFFDFDPLASSLSDVTPPIAQLQNHSTDQTMEMLVVPSGQVMMGYNNGTGASGGDHIMFYTPDGGPQAAWKPTITSITANGNHFTLTGTQLNGLSDGVDRSVSTEMASNYPIIELKDASGIVYFARTFNWSTTAVQTGSTPVTTDFALPSYLPGGAYSLTVIANGITSDPVPFLAPVPGDFNFDGQLTGADLPAMMAALVDLKTFKQAYGVSDATLLSIGDLNGDHVVNNADLQALLPKLRYIPPSNAPQMVLDINNTIAVGSAPDDLLTIGNTTYFTADDGIHGRELWKSNGTAAGTKMVKDINPGKDKSNPIYLTELNGQLYFSADDGADGYELWKSDGTEAGTMMVEDLFAGTYYDQKSQSFRAYSSYPGPFTKFNGELYFPANDGDHGFELWKTDGTKDGTVLVKDIAPGAFDGLPYGGVYSFLTPIGGELYFAADDGDHGSELWKTDGTEGGTVLVKDIVPGSFGSEPYNLINMNGTLFFDAFQDNTGNDELFKSDGTGAGTVLVADINPGSAGSYLYSPTPINGILYFAAKDGSHGKELWRSDGTTTGTQLVADLNAGPTGAQLGYLTNLNDTLFFAANDGVHGSELWKTDGTTSGTVLVKDIDPGSAGSNVKGIVNVNGTLYFSANDGVHGNELWKSDGTAAGTVLVEDINQRSVDSNPGNFTVLGNSLLFTADDGFHGTELWKLPLANGSGSAAADATLVSPAVQTSPVTPASSSDDRHQTEPRASGSEPSASGNQTVSIRDAVRGHHLPKREGPAWSLALRAWPSPTGNDTTSTAVAVATATNITGPPTARPPLIVGKNNLTGALENIGWCWQRISASADPLETSPITHRQPDAFGAGRLRLLVPNARAESYGADLAQLQRYFVDHVLEAASWNGRHREQHAQSDALIVRSIDEFFASNQEIPTAL